MNTSIYTVTMRPGHIDFSPSTPQDEIMQNVITFCTTPKGSRPLDRDYGIEQCHVDKPYTRETARISNEIITGLKKYEPRAIVTAITYEWYDNTIYPRVSIAINE